MNRLGGLIHPSNRIPHVWILLTLSLAPAIAQTGVDSGLIRGFVADSSGAVIPDATITLISHSTGAADTHTSNSAGMFVFSAQPVGTYSMEAKAPGFRTQIVDGVDVQVGQSTSVNLRLVPGAASESITVNGESPLLRPEESDISSVVDRELLQDLPLSGRRFLDFALLVPNASPDGQQGLVTFAGEQGGQDTGYANANGTNSFTIDGASATSNYFGAARGGERVPYVFGENAIEEFQVAVSPYRAEYGGAASGFVNVVSRSGSDSIHGGAFYYNRNSGTGADDAVDKAAGIPRPVDILQQFGASLGAPVVRHHAWLFGDYEQQKQKDPISVINPAFADVSQTDFQVPDSSPLPAPNASFPVPGNISAPDPSSATYLQQVSNALFAIRSNLGVQPRYRNDWSVFNRFDYHDNRDDRFYLSLNWNRFDSPSGMITSNNTPLFGMSTLANSFVRDDHASFGWSRAIGNSLLNELRSSFSRDDQYSTPTGRVDPVLPSVVLSPAGGEDSGGSNLELGNAGFAGGHTDEAFWQISDHATWVRGRHTLKSGFEFSATHVTDLAFGGFDPDAQAQNGTFRGTYSFSSLTNFALGIYDNFFQSTGQPKFSFNVPYMGFYFQDTLQVRPHLTIDFGLREDFQVYPQPSENPAFPLTGQFRNQYARVVPRLGFAAQAANKTVLRGGFGMFYENLNGLNYRNAVVSNGRLSQQASVSMEYDPTLSPERQIAIFPHQISDVSQFSASDISLVDPHFRFPSVLQGSLQIEREILPETVVTAGATWSHGIHLLSSSAYDLNLNPPTGSTAYRICPAGTTNASQCAGGHSVVLPNLDSGLLTEGRVTSNFGQINELISPGLNRYNSFFVQAQRRFHDGVSFQGAYTLAKNIASHGVDFNDQFDFSNTRAPYLLDQRHRVSVAGVLEPGIGSHFDSGFSRAALSGWKLSTVMQFASGRPYSALMDISCAADDISDGCPDDAPQESINNTAALQATANSALGINSGSPSPVAGLNSFYGPWTQQIDLGLARSFNLSERHSIAFEAQAFNLLNHANYYVQNGTGVSQVEYEPFGSTCGDGQSQNQQCYLVPRQGFGRLLVINALNGPRVLQFAMTWSF